ncbi:hypothetical protein NL676_007064 [Syzygium grande]|nr:hypothetical protein NL676_007064 [Syzygium grande]
MRSLCHVGPITTQPLSCRKRSTGGRITETDNAMEAPDADTCRCTTAQLAPLSGWRAKRPRVLSRDLAVG